MTLIEWPKGFNSWIDSEKITIIRTKLTDDRLWYVEIVFWQKMSLFYRAESEEEADELIRDLVREINAIQAKKEEN